jgi:excisionase family DNA binding protein
VCYLLSMDPENLITRKQAAIRAGVDIRTVDYWRREGKLTTYRTRGYHVRIDPAQLDDYLEIAPEQHPTA